MQLTGTSRQVAAKPLTGTTQMPLLFCMRKLDHMVQAGGHGPV